MTDFLSNSEMAALMYAGVVDPTHHKTNFTMSTELSNSFESHIKGLGQKKVFGHLNVRRQGFQHGWVGSITAPDLSEFFSNTREKTSAQHYSRILASLRERKMLFQIWFNMNRSIGAHLSLTWLCLDPAQWDDIFTGCPIYPITLSRFINSIDSLEGSLWNELRKLKISQPVIRIEDLVPKEMIKAIFAQFVSRMHPDIKKEIPLYDPKTDAREFLSRLDRLIKQWPAYYGIENSKFQGSNDLQKRITDFAKINAEKDFENHSFSRKTQVLSGVLDSTTDSLSSVLDSTTDLVSGVLDSTTESQNLVNVTCSISNELQFPSCARDRELDLRKELEEKKENKRGDSSRNKENKTDKTKHCINKKTTKEGNEKMTLNDSVLTIPGDSGFGKKTKPNMPKKQSTSNTFDLGSPRQYDIKTPSGIFVAVRESMFKKHKLKFNGRFETNIRNANLIDVMDEIKESGYLDDEILTEWVSWYTNVFMTHEKIMRDSSKFISAFTNTWKIFSRTVSRPEERDVRRREIMAHKISDSSASSEIGSHLERIMQKTKNVSEGIETMLLQFGIVVVGNWMERKLKQKDASERIREVLSSMGKMKLLHVYGMTVMRESRYITSGAVPFFDWKKIYQEIFENIEDDDIEPVDYECDEVDRFLTSLAR